MSSKETAYINRELSWLEFNHRVMEESLDERNPLFERVKFLAIVSSNLDEFYMVRVASLWDQVFAKFEEKDPSGLRPIEQIERIYERTKKLVKEQYESYDEVINRKIQEGNVKIMQMFELSELEMEYVENYYLKNIYPVLTPMVADSSRPFPLISNKSLNIGLLVKGENSKKKSFANLQVPSVLSRFIRLPEYEEGKARFVLLEELMKHFISSIFSGHEILAMSEYRITRNADLDIDEDGAEDLLKEIEKSLKLRKWGHVIRLECKDGMDKRILAILKDRMDIPNEGIFTVKGPLDLTFLMKFASIKESKKHLYPNLNTKLPTALAGYTDIFESIRKQDILLHHPYDSFSPVVDLIEKSADDENVLAIKQTLYRVSGNSPIIDALIKAAENGKQVTVLVELKARFDEENNIIWAKKLERAGAHVIYGLLGLKTHCKLLLIVRKEENGIRRYVHMGTGNYNDVTARFYTDMGFLTCNPKFGADASAVFNMLSGYSKISSLYKIDLAPSGLRHKVDRLIEREIRNAKDGKGARIIVKMNSLVDVKIIKLLYQASNAGVQIDLIIRGVCSLVAGVKGMSENIRIKSIVGRFLEHSRIFYFYNDGAEEYYLSSADWMERNLNRRVEILFPVEDEENREKLSYILEMNLKDNQKSRIQDGVGTYVMEIEKKNKVDCQKMLLHNKIQ